MRPAEEGDNDMPRIRTIKPELPDDEVLGQVSREARLTFVLLWTRADDFGRFRASPALLRSQLFPYDEDLTAAEVGRWVDELVDAGRLRRYEVAGQQYGEVTNWTKHQRIDNAGKTNIPPPPWAPDPPPADLCGDSRRTAANVGGSPLDQDQDRDQEGTNPRAAESSTALVLVPPGPPSPSAPVQQVFDAWVAATGRTSRTVLDPKRRRLIGNALKQYPLDEVLDAVRGWRNSPHHCGQNPQGNVYNDLGLLLRDPAHIERFRDLARTGPSRPISTTDANLARWAAGYEGAS